MPAIYRWQIATLVELGRYERAKDFLRESIDLCEQARNRWGLGTAYRFLGWASMSAGEYKEAQAHLRTSLEIFGEYITGWDIALSLTYLGEATLMAGDLSNSRSILMEGLCLALEARATPIALEALLGLAEIDARKGEAERAFKILTCVSSHPASEQKMKDRATELIPATEKLLTGAQVDVIRKQVLK